MISTAGHVRSDYPLARPRPGHDRLAVRDGNAPRHPPGARPACAWPIRFPWMPRRDAWIDMGGGAFGEWKSSHQGRGGSRTKSTASSRFSPPELPDIGIGHGDLHRADTGRASAAQSAPSPPTTVARSHLRALGEVHDVGDLRQALSRLRPSTPVRPAPASSAPGHGIEPGTHRIQPRRARRHPPPERWRRVRPPRNGA